MLQRLKHTNVVECLEVIEPNSSDPNAYIVMELMDCSLLDFLSHVNVLNESQIATIFSKIVSGVKHCHTEGFIHHDLKLENILLNIDNNGNITDVKLADFGLSRR